MSAFTHIARRFIVPATGVRSDGLRSAFDIEANSLLHTATAVHCIVIIDLDSGQIYEYGPGQISAALAHLARADYLTGHNITGYDLPLLERLHGWRPKPGCTIVDTLVASRLILPNIADLDDQAAAMGDTPLGALRGRYSLEAWGARLGIPKVGTDITDFSVWTKELQDRCVGDAAITKATWRFLQPDGYSQQARELEHSVALICSRITADGVPFDVNAAERLRQQWAARRTELKARLSQQFPGTNLNSRQQIGALLEARGWVPEKRTEKTGQPQIDDELLETIPAVYPEFVGLAEYMLLGRRLGQLCDRREAWCRHVDADGRIRGGLIHIGHAAQPRQAFKPKPCASPQSEKGEAVRNRMPRPLSRAGGLGVCHRRPGDAAGSRLRPLPH
jgi:DNA polymerase-1